VFPLPAIEDVETEMFALAVVPEVAKLNEPLATILDPAALAENDVTVATPVPPTTLSVSAELKSRIMMSLSRSSNVPVSYLIRNLPHWGCRISTAGNDPAVSAILYDLPIAWQIAIRANRK
jgi:hypothetical protein